jgi:hypothetical protein
MATRMQQRRSPASEWSTANPILAPGEIGFETDTTKFKIGDGVNHWTDLSYFDNIDNIGGSLGDYVPLSQKGAEDGVATLDSTGNVPFSQLGNIIDGAPAVLDTLNEIAAAIGNDDSFITTITTSIATKQDKVSGVSDTEIGYLDGVTSSIQTQLDSKLDSVNLTEAAQDAVNAALVAGAGIDKTYDDASNTITLDIDSTVATKTYADSAVSTAVSGLTKSSVGLGSVDNTSDANKPISTATQTALDTKLAISTAASTYETITNVALKAPLASPVLTGTPTAPTASVGTSTTQIATTAFVGTAVANLVNSAPSTLDTLGELATALQADESAATTLSTLVGTKAPLASPALTGTPTAPTAVAGTNTTQVSTTAFVKTAIDALKTADIEEQTNLYFTDQRAVDAIVYAINHGLNITLDGGAL